MPLEDTFEGAAELAGYQITDIGTQCQRSAGLGLTGDAAVLGVEAQLPPGTRLVLP